MRADTNGLKSAEAERIQVRTVCESIQKCLDSIPSRESSRNLASRDMMMAAISSSHGIDFLFRGATSAFAMTNLTAIVSSASVQRNHRTVYCVCIYIYTVYFLQGAGSDIERVRPCHLTTRKSSRDPP